MGTGVAEITLAQLAALGKYNNVIFYNNPADNDLIKTIVGSPRTILINLGQFLNIATGSIQGDALDETISAAQIEAGAVGTSELASDALAANPAGRLKMATGYFDEATLLDKIATDQFTEAVVDDLFAADAINAADRLKAGSIISDRIASATIADDRMVSSLVKDPGALATGVLRVTGVYADGEAITIGNDTYEVDPIVAASSDTCDGADFDNVTADLVVDMNNTDYPNIGQGVGGALVLGELIYIDTEYLRVTLIETNNVTFQRGAGGSGIANHTTGTGIFISAGTPAPTSIPIGVQAVFAAATVTPIQAETINEAATEDVSADDVMGDGTILLVVAKTVGNVILGTTDTHTNGVWDFTAMRRGADAAVRQQANISIVPDTEEVGTGDIFVPLPFFPTVVQVLVLVTSTGAHVAWVGNIEIVAAAGVMPDYLILDNIGAPDWSVNDTIHITVTS